MGDKNQIWQIIKDLLHEHDCVIVPNFGGFVGNREPARIDQISHLITPPAKRIVFNQNLKTNDGLLVNRVAQQLQLAYIDALKTIDEWVEQIKNELQKNKSYEVNYFGTFRLNADANFVFLPDKQNTYLPSSFGLAPLQTEPVAARTVKANKVRVFKERKDIKRVKKSNGKIWRRSLTAVVVLTLGVNAFIFMQDQNFRIGNSEMNITSWFDSLFNDTAKVEEKFEAEVKTGAEIEVENATIAENIEQIENIETDIETAEPITEETLMQTEEDNTSALTSSNDYTQDYYSHATNIALARKQWYFPEVKFKAEIAEADTEAPEATTSQPIPESQPELGETPDNNEPANKKMPANKLAGKSAATDSLFYIIGGVFCQERNAVKYYNQLKEKGYEPELLLNKNMNCKRVSYASFRTRKEAEMLLMDIKTRENPAAWIFVRKEK